MFPEITIRVVIDASSLQGLLSMLLSGVATSALAPTLAPVAAPVAAIEEAAHSEGEPSAEKRSRGRPRKEATAIAPAAPVAPVFTQPEAATVSTPTAADVGPSGPAPIPADLMPAASVSTIAAPATAPPAPAAPIDRIKLQSAIIRYVQKPGVGVAGFSEIKVKAFGVGSEMLTKFNPGTSAVEHVEKIVAALREADPAAFQ